MKKFTLMLAAAVVLQTASGCCLFRRICPARPAVAPAPVCAPAPTCCPSTPCGGCDCCSGAPTGGYIEPGIQYAPASPGVPMTYGNSAPLPPGP